MKVTSNDDGTVSALFDLNKVACPIKGELLDVMSFKTRPSLSTLRQYLRENRYITITNKRCGTKAMVTWFEADYANVLIGGERKTWYWLDVDELIVGCDVNLNDDIFGYLKKWVGCPSRHISLVFKDGALSVNMSYMNYQKDTKQVFLKDGEDNYFYVGTDFLFEHQTSAELEAFNIKRIREHATRWLEHKNPYKVGDLIEWGDVVGIVVRTYETEADGTNYYDTDIATGDFGLPVPVHSFNFKCVGMSK